MSFHTSFIIGSLFICTIIIVIFLIKCVYATRVLWFYKDSCIYCKNMKKEWEDFWRRSMLKLFVCAKAIDVSTKKGAKLQADFNLTTVPNIVKIVGNNKYLYSGPRTADAIEKWASRAD